MQKIINVLAVSSAVVSLALVGSVGYLYVNRTAIVEDIIEKAIESVLGDGLGGLGGATDSLPTGANDLSPVTNPAAVPQASVGLPSL